MMNNFLTKKDALNIFKEESKDFLAKASKLDKVLAWNDFTDMLHKDGQIRDNQVNNWANPFEYRK